MEGLLTGILIFLGTVVIAIAIGRILKKLEEYFKKTENIIDDIIIEAMSLPIMLIIIFFGIYIGATFAFPNFTVFGFPVTHIIIVILIFVVAFIISRIVSAVIKWYMHEIAPKTKTTLDDKVLPILSKIIMIFIYIIAFIVVLHYFNVEITPALAGLGIAGLAVALALQPVLSNFFSGISMVSDKAINIGDLIELESGEIGTVTAVSWRSVKIRTFQNDMITIPNSKLADSRVKNHTIPDTSTTETLELGVSYDSDLKKVEKVLYDTAKKVIKNNPEAANDAFEPLIRFFNFGDSSIGVKVIYGSKTYGGKFLLKHHLIKEIHKEFRKKKIEIPYPIRTVKIKRR